MSIAVRDSNRVTSLMGVSSVDGTTPLPVLINPATGRILISATIADNTSTQKVIIAKAGTTVGTRDKINFIEGAGIALTIADSVGDDRVNVTVAATGGGTGTVTSVSVVSANGLAGTVATDTTTPAITLSTTVTGVLKGNGTAISAASAGTDYVGPGAVTTSGLTMATGKILGRDTALTGAIEELNTTGSGDVVRATSPTLVTPALGTPSALVGTNITGTASGLTAGAVTGFSPASGSLTLSGDDALTLTTSAATNVTLPTTGTLATLAGTETFTNKRVTKRVVTVNAPGATPSTNTDNGDIFQFTGLNAAITSMTTNLSGTPVNGDMVQFSFVDDGTARAITWGASFANGGLVSLPTTTVISTVLRVLVQYQTIASLNKWVCVAVA